MKRAILIIDVQQVYTNPDSPLYCRDNGAVIDRINRIVAKGQAAGDVIVHIRHQHRADGTDAGHMFDFSCDAQDLGFVEGAEETRDDPRLHLPDQVLRVTKQRYSSFVGTGLDERLRAMGVGRIVVTGFMTNFCCEATARHGHDLDFLVDLVLDATGCPDLSEEATQGAIKAMTAATLSAGCARVLLTDAWIGQA